MKSSGTSWFGKWSKRYQEKYGEGQKKSEKKSKFEDRSLKSGKHLSTGGRAFSSSSINRYPAMSYIESNTTTLNCYREREN